MQKCQQAYRVQQWLKGTEDIIDAWLNKTHLRGIYLQPWGDFDTL